MLLTNLTNSNQNSPSAVGPKMCYGVTAPNTEQNQLIANIFTGVTILAVLTYLVNYYS